MKGSRVSLALLLAAAAGIAALVGVDQPSALSSFFSSRCESCHGDDSPTCAGCHFHKGTLIATADEPLYRPGQLVTVRLAHSGSYTGWIRAALYDHLGNQVALATGPTGTGDDGLGNPVTFPVDLQASAPSEAGDFTWQAAYYGANNTGSSHTETRVNVTIHVEIDLGVEEWPAPEAENRLRLAIAPNPAVERTSIHFSVPAGESVVLNIVDGSGRVVRSLLSQASGRGAVSWDTLDESGRPVQSGTYFATLAGGGRKTAQSLLVLR